MEYERIHSKLPSSSSSQGGGISPGKLRFMLLGVEKKRKQEDEDEELQLHSKSPDEDSRDAVPDSCCKVVDIVTALPPEYCSVSITEMEVAASGATFEFQRAERAPAMHRPSGVVPPFSKPAPSKWDDAQKWIASPTSSRHGKGGVEAKRTARYGSRQPALKVMVEVPEEPDTKRIDQSQVVKKEVGERKGVSSAPESHPVADSYSKPAILVECSAVDSAVNRSQHGASTTVQSDTAFVSPPSTVRSVSMRDMGTEMTPIASQEPSRTGTPVRANTPIRSPTSSRPSSPGITAKNATVEAADCQGEDNRRELTEKELKLKTRREIVALGTKLGKTNIAAWASKEEEDKDASATLKTVSIDPPEKKVIETRAAAWEEAEKAKYLARFKREEIKIQAWENHQKAKAEAEMRKIEVDVERTRANAHDRLMSKLAALRQRAEEKLAVAEAKRNREATRASEQADFIRRTGQVPSSFLCWCCCS